MSECGPFRAIEWTDSKIEELKFLAVTEKLPASKIAARFGCTRNVICGKLYRLGIRADKIAIPDHPKQRPARKKAPKKNPWQPVPRLPCEELPVPETDAVPDPSTLCTLMELKPYSCRWVCGDPRHPDSRFCGAKKIEGGSYCGFHSRIVYAPAVHRIGWIPD